MRIAVAPRTRLSVAVRCRSLLAALALFGATTLSDAFRLAAQAPSGNQSPSAQTPVFRSGVRLIDVDVYVTDQQGRPIKGLTRDDFELLEDGKPQEVRAFTPIDLPVDVPGTSA